MIDSTTLFKSLSDETRLITTLLIAHEKELCVCELTAALEEIQPKVSRHLAQLRKNGILNDRKQGQWVFYRINEEQESWVKNLISLTLTNNESLLTKPLDNLNKMGNRPERLSVCC